MSGDGTTGRLLLRLDDAGAALTCPEGWGERQVTSDELAKTLDGLGDNVVVLVVAEGAAVQAMDAIAPPEEPLTGGIHVGQMPSPPAPAGDDDDASDEPSPGWQRGLAVLGGTLDTDAWPALPEGLARLAPVRNVLENAGQIGLVTLASGETYVACGFPDLLRPASKVLLVREGDPQPEIVALHRHPRKVGVVVFGDESFLPSADLDPDPISEDITGAVLGEWGTLFAVEGDAVYVSRSGRIFRFDGRRETDVGTASQAMASLVLRWSQR
jgi:hypothetical protein